MKKRVLLMTLLLGLLSCEQKKDLAAKAGPSGDAGQALPSPTQAAAARVWAASLAAEAAGKLDEALSGLTQLPSPQREGYLASYRRGWLLYRLGRYAEAVGAYNVAIAIEPSGIEARVAMMAPQMALTKWDDLASTAQEVLKRDPENYLALKHLAFAKFSAQRLSEAELLYRHLVQLYPGDVEMRVSLGWTVLRMGKQKEAADLFGQVLEIAPSHVSAAAGYREATAHKKGKH
jgi:tetratricopeptide (TPR) repeat protein